MQLKQIQLEDVCAFRRNFFEHFVGGRVVEVDAGDGSSGAFEDDVFHLLNVNLFGS